MRIYLVGYMYSGKTTLGRQLARRIGYSFHDLDIAFEERYHCTVPLFFQKYGEEAFRKLEQQMLHRSTQLDNTIISTGGGTPCFFDNMDFINRNGISVYLEMSQEALISRMSASRKPRPVFANLSDEERSARLTKQLQQRLPYSQKAHITINAFNPDADALAATIKKYLI